MKNSVVKLHRIALYCRVSSDRQEDTGYGLDAQFDRCMIYCDLRNIDLNLVDLYVDGGISGSTTDRPEYQDMMLSIANGIYDQMIIAKLDRVSRNVVDFTELLNFLSENDVTLISIDDNLDVNNLTGRMVSQIRMIFAELEQKLDVERTNESIIARIKSSIYPHRGAPFGYSKDERKALYINEREASILELMKQELFSTRSIQNVYAACITHYPEYHWSIQKIKHIFQSRIYTGGLEFKGVFYKNNFPILTSETEYKKIMEILDAKSKDRKYFYLYKDLLFCAKCGEKLICTCGKSCTGKTYLYYKCKKCKINISDEMVRILLKPFLEKIITTSPDIEKNVELNIKKMNQTKDKVYKRKSEIFEKYMAGYISIDDFVKLNDKINERLHSIESSLKKSKNDFVDQKIHMFERSSKITQFALLHRLIKKVDIDIVEKKIISIYFYDENM